MAEPAKDVVCGMTVDPERTPHHHVHDGATYHFCGARCLERFRAEPARFLGEAPAPPARPGAEYTCPMHPEVVKVGPGSCPICGMALEPRDVSLAVEDANPELDDMTRRFWICLALTAPLFLLAMSDIVPGQPVQRAVGHRALAWIQLLLATPVVLWGGWPFFARAVDSIRTRPSEHVHVDRAWAPGWPMATAWWRRWRRG